MPKQLKQFQLKQTYWQSRIVVNGGLFANRTNHSAAGHAKAIAMSMATGVLLDRVNQLTTNWRAHFDQKAGVKKRSLGIVLFTRFVQKKHGTVAAGKKQAAVPTELMDQWPAWG